jgi:hypothetical protein
MRRILLAVAIVALVIVSAASADAVNHSAAHLAHARGGR